MFRVYVVNHKQKSRVAQDNLRAICSQYLNGKAQIEVVDLLKNPKLAKDEQIVAIPTVERKCPSPKRRVVGDLSNVEHTLSGLDIPARKK